MKELALDDLDHVNGGGRVCSINGGLNGSDYGQMTSAPFPTAAQQRYSQQRMWDEQHGINPTQRAVDTVWHDQMDKWEVFNGILGGAAAPELR